MRHAIIAVFLLAALAGTAVAGPFDDAFSAHERGDYTVALREFRALAEQGHAEAQYRLAFMYYDGDGVTPDYVQAHMWFILADAQGIKYANDYRDAAAEFMTRANIAEAQKLAREWRPK